MWSLNLESLHHLLSYLGHHLLFDAAVGGVCLVAGCAIACMAFPDEDSDCFFHRQVF